jgi:hypothetical protein
MAVGFQVSDHGLDGGAAPQFAFNDAEDAALLAGDEDAARVGGVMAAVSLIDIGALPPRGSSSPIRSATSSRHCSPLRYEFELSA